MQRQSTLAEGDRALERNGRRGKENHDESQLESGDSQRSGGNLVVNVDEKIDPLLLRVIRDWPMLTADVKTAIVTITCGCQQNPFEQSDEIRA